MKVGLSICDQPHLLKLAIKHCCLLPSLCRWQLLGVCTRDEGFSPFVIVWKIHKNNLRIIVPCIPSAKHLAHFCRTFGFSLTPLTSCFPVVQQNSAQLPGPELTTTDRCLHLQPTCAGRLQSPGWLPTAKDWYIAHACILGFGRDTM